MEWLKRISEKIYLVTGSRVKDKSFRRKYKYYYALTFITPVLVILLANMYSSQILKKQILKSNEKVLKQFFDLVEGEMAGVLKDAYSIAIDLEVQEYGGFITQEKNIDLSKKASLVDKLNNYCIGYEDVFVWYSDKDYVVSGINPVAVTTFTGLEAYSKAFYGENERIQTEMQGALNNKALSQILWPITQEEESQCFAVSINRYQGISKLPNYVMALVVDASFIERCIGDGVLVQGENAMLFNEEGELLYSHEPLGTSFLEEKYRSTGTYEIEKDGKRSTFLVRKSKTMEGYYAIEIPHELFYKDLFNVQKISYWGIAVSILIGSIVMRWMSNSTYQPLEQLLTRFQEEMERRYEPKKNNEFEFLEEVLEQRGNEKSSITVNAKERDEKRRKKLLLVALEGRELNEAEIEFLEKQASLFPCFSGGILMLKNCGKVGWELIGFVVTNIFEEIFQEEYSCAVISVSFNRYVIVLNKETEVCEERVEQLLKKGIGFMEQYLGIYAQFGMGNVCEGLYNLRNMYRQGQYALEYCFFKEKETIIHYRDVQGRYAELPFSPETPMANMVREFINQENIVEISARECVNRIIKKYRLHEESSVETVTYFKYEVLKVLNGVWSDCDMEYFLRQSYIQQLNEAAYFEKYIACLASIICETAKQSQIKRTKNSLADQVKKYVDENYMDADLSVASIGDAFGMQAAYLSKIFREEYGMLILNYISSMRINHAKKLLKESKLTINEIAQSTGFLSGNVLIKTFKKYTGVTPGKYRTANAAMDYLPENKR